MKIYDLKFLLDKKSQGAGAYCLNHAPKTGIMHASSLQLEMADRYVYEAFQPILEEDGLTKKDFLNNNKVKRNYRTAYINLLYTTRRNPQNFIQEYPNLFSEDGTVNIREFTTMTNDISKKWIEFKNNIKENPSKEQYLDRLREEVTYGGFFATNSKMRSLLMTASRDQNRAEDRNTFKSLEAYITKKESVDYQQFMDSPELRELYRKKYLTIKAELQQKENPARNSYETADEAIQRISQKWTSIATVSEDISKGVYERFVTSYPIETFSQLTPLEIDNLDNQTLKLMQRFREQKNQQIRAEKMKEIDQLQQSSQKFRDDLDDMFRQPVTTRVGETLNDFNTILKNTREKENKIMDESAPKKK